jgi:hypothetical protein
MLVPKHRVTHGINLTYLQREVQVFAPSKRTGYDMWKRDDWKPFVVPDEV